MAEKNRPRWCPHMQAFLDIIQAGRARACKKTVLEIDQAVSVTLPETLPPWSTYRLLLLPLRLSYFSAQSGRMYLECKRALCS